MFKRTQKKGAFGDLFEKMIVRDCRMKAYTIIKIREEFVGVYSLKAPIQKRTEFDFACGIHGKSLFFDAKFINQKKLNIKTYIMNSKKIHQFYNLMDCYNRDDNAGYLVYFYPIKTITWFPIHVLDRAVHIDKDKYLSPDIKGSVSQSAHSIIDLKALTFPSIVENNNIATFVSQ